ncbi:hypothetical protein DFQ29_004460 [Apophysomyces sp. BC1021]|nr:hypothetical protein DFQ29_004460 [Apophysomyces sp. BC1021]
MADASQFESDNHASNEEAPSKDTAHPWAKHNSSCCSCSSSTDSTEITHENDNTERATNSDVDKRGNPAACVFVASLTKEKNDEQLNVSVSNHFTQWGVLLNVKVLKDWMGRPYAFVQYERMSDAKNALREAPGTMLDGRNIRCEPARVNRTLCLAALETKVTEKEIQAKLSPFGEVEDITLPKPSSQNQSCAFVKFRYRDDAIKAFLSLRSSQVMEHWCVEWASNLDINMPGPALLRTDKTSIFVGNLPDTVTENAMYARFGPYGKITFLRIHRKMDGAGRKRAFAFVKYTNEQGATAAIQQEASNSSCSSSSSSSSINGALWVGRHIRVAYREYHDSLANRSPRSPYMERPHPPGMGFPASIYQHLVISDGKDSAKTRTGESRCYFQSQLGPQPVGSTSHEASGYYDSMAYMPYTNMNQRNRYREYPVYPYYPMPVYSPPHDQSSAYYDNPYYTSMYYVYPPFPQPIPPTKTWQPKPDEGRNKTAYPMNSKTKEDPSQGSPSA